MATFNFLRIMTTLVVAVVIAFIAGFAMINTESFFVGAVIFTFLSVAYWLQGLADIFPDPPTRAVPKFWTAFINADSGSFSLKSGRWFFPLRGLLFGYDTYDASQTDLTLSVDEWTPDGNKITVNPFFTYIVNPDHPAWFINTGRKAGAEQKLDQRVEGRMREWISSRQEGPLTWQEALQSNGLGMDVLIQKLFPGQLPPVPPALIAIVAAIPGGDNISLSMFIRYFIKKPALPEKAEEKDLELKKNEVRAKKILDKLKTTDRPTWDALRDAVQRRVDFVENVKAGGCRFPIDNLGIIILLASIASISPDDATAAAADRVAAATQDMRVRTIKSDNQRQRIESMKPTFGGDAKLATETIQLLDEEIEKKVTETQVGLQGDNVRALLTLLGPIGKALGERIAKP